MATNVGTIEVLATLDTSQYKKGEKDIEKSNSNMEKSSEKASNSISASFSKAAKVGLVAATAATAALTAALTKASMASWSQVAAVEQATVGLRAYERDAGKVDEVLGSLIKYARSDMGVLFNRKDLFQSAQMLKLNGVATDDLSKNVQILSRSVGLGLGNWQDLNSVVGRVVSTGRLSGIEFDQLTQYGFKLDKSLRNTNMSATELFKALDKGIPVDAMKGQANTIRGLGIRIESAFRGIGDTILGVDADTSKFIKGGLGDLITRGLSILPKYLKDFSKGIKDAQNYATIFFDVITKGQSSLDNNSGLGKRVHDIAKTIRDWGIVLGELFLPKLSALWNTVREDVLPVLMRLWKEVLEPLVPVFGTVLVAALAGAVDAFNILLSAVTGVINFILDNKWVIGSLTLAIGGLALALNFSAIASAFAVSAGSIIASMGAIGGAAKGLMGMLNPFTWAITVSLLGFGIVMDQINQLNKAVDGADEAIRKRDINKYLETYEAIKKRDPAAARRYAEMQSRASGGPVRAGELYAVGDNPDGSWNRTTELFVPNQSGTIIPSKTLQGMTGGGNITQNNNIYNEVDMDRAMRDLAWRIAY